MVQWESPTSQEEACALAYRYGRGDGESGVGDFRYGRYFYEYQRHAPYAPLPQIPDLLEHNLFLGFLDGRQRRTEIEFSRRGVDTVVLVLGLSHIADPDNPLLPAVLSLIATNKKVVYVGANSTPAAPVRVWLDTDLSLLETYDVADFNWGDFLQRYASVLDRVSVFYPRYHQALGALVEKLKAKTGNSVQVFEQLAKLEKTASIKLRAIADAAQPLLDMAPPSQMRGSRPNVLPIKSAKSGFRSLQQYGRRFVQVLREEGLQEATRRARSRIMFPHIQTAGEASARIGAELSHSTPPAARAQRPTYDIISFPIMPWLSRVQRSQQLLVRFAENGTRVFRIDRGFLLSGDAPYAEKVVRNNITQVTLAAARDMSIYSDTLDDQSVELMLQALTHLRERRDILDAACIVELPFWYPIAKAACDAFGWRLIYDCMDEHAGFATNQDDMVSLETQLASDASAVVVTSGTLFEKMKVYGEKCRIIRNATDFDHFANPPKSGVLKHHEGPIIGYYGALSEWFDQELVAHVARSRPEWTIVLVGGNDSGIGFDLLESLPNVHLLGEKPYAELPAYLYWFDVCIIPFRLSKLIEATNPVKYYEYISAGKPVVSVMLPELLPYRECVYLADTPEEFEAKISLALVEDSTELRNRRAELARANTWESRQAELKQLIHGMFGRASIVVVTYNNLEFTKACIDSLYAHTHPGRFELIVVDNASRDDTPSYLQRLAAQRDNVRIILNENNRGFAAANNQGISIASAEYVVLLNNDTVVTPGWLSKLLRHLDDPAVGMVGPATNMCGNEAIVYVDYDGATLDGFSDFVRRYYALHTHPESFDIDMLSMFCVAARRETMDEIGPLDECFGVGLFEDTDYSHRMKLRGYKLISARDVFVHHFCKSSFGKLPNDEYARIYEENRKKFEDKWNIESRY